MHPPKKPRVFYGYWIVLVAFFCLFICAGTAAFGFSLFVKPLEADFGWGRGEIMAAYTIIFLIMAIASPFIGRTVDRYGARKIIATGGLVAGLGYALLSLTNSLWFFYIGHTIIGLGMAAMGPVPTSAVVSNWFEKKRGMAIGIMSTGMGTGGFAMAPLIGGYLIPHFGWRVSYLAIAVLILVLIIPLALLLIKTRPADMGLYPDGTEAAQAIAATVAPSSAVGGLTLRMALATPVFWLIGASFLLILFSENGVIQSQVPYLVDIGFPVTIAATALGAVAFMSAVGKFGFGWLCDRIPAKYPCSIGLGLQVAGIIILMNVGPDSPVAAIWLYAIVMGLSAGSWLPAMSMITSTTFGLASYGAIFGMVSLFQGIGTATGPLVAGYMYDIMNNYHRVFIIMLVLCAVAIPAILAIRRPKSP